MVEIETLTFINIALVSVLFSLLIVSMSVRFSEVKVLATWADARSLANSIGTRAYTSADCFAYESINLHYDGISGRLVEQRRVYPGIIDSRKFTEDKYFDCIQNYYFAPISEIPFLAELPAESAFVIEFTLIDLTDPFRLRELKDRRVSTREHLRPREATAKVVEKIVSTLEMFSLYMGAITTAASIALNIALGLLTHGMFGLEIYPIVYIGEIWEFYWITPKLIHELDVRSSVYQKKVPVVIRYVDEDGRIEADHMGILEVEIRYMA
jgi:hypothetical protein